MKVRSVNVILLSIPLWLVVVPASAPAQEEERRRPCDTAEGHQLDFWIGEWELKWPAGQGGAPEDEPGRGSNTITRVLDDCIVHEEFESETTGLSGRSWSAYDARSGEWRQTWVDDQGSYLTFTGGMRDGRMELYGPERTGPDGRPFRMRMIWTDVTEDSLVWRYQRTTDDGESWTDAWVIRYRRGSPGEAGR